MNFTVNGANAGGSLNVRARVRWNMAVNLTARHRRTKTSRNVTVTLHEAAERGVVDSADLISGEIGPEQHFRATGNVLENVAGTILPHNGNVRCESDDVPVWEHANRSNHLDLIVDGASAVSSFVMCSVILWKMVVPPESTTWRTNSRGDQRGAS